MDDDTATATEAATDELTDLVLDRLLPVVQRYQHEVARRLGLGLPELQCLELLRIQGPRASWFIGDRTGLSRSTVSKMLRRLEEAGHVRRTVGVEHAQEVDVELVPHETRDLWLHLYRQQVRTTVREAVTRYGLHRHHHLAGAAGLLIQLVGVLHRAATEQALARWNTATPARHREAERVRARRRRQAPPDRTMGW